MSPGKLKARSLMQKLETLQAELASCTTAAMRACVQVTIDDTRRQLREAVAS